MPRSPASKAPAAKTATKRKKNVGDADVLASLRFYPAKDLHNRLLLVLDEIETATDATLHNAKLSETVNELTSAGLDYYFIRTLKEAKAGFVTQQSANIGIIGVKQVMAPVVRNIIGRLEHAQLQVIARSIRHLMIER